MKSNLAISIAILGWCVPLVFLAHENFAFHEIRRHILHPSTLYEFFSHIFLFVIIPLTFTFTGYLINERKKLFATLKESEEKYLDLYENAPDGYHSCGPDGLILKVNNTWLTMLGYERDEVERKMNFADLLTENDRREFQSSFAELKEQGVLLNKQRDLRRKDGIVLPVIINASAIYDEKGNFLKSRSIVRDNRMQESYERKLKNSAQAWRETFDSMPYGVMLVDKEFNVIRANTYIAEIGGAPIQEIPGRKCFEIIHGTDTPPEFCPLHNKREIKITTTYVYSDKRTGKSFMGYITPLIAAEKGITENYIVSLVDITEVRNKEMKLLQSRDAFLNMLKDLDVSFKELREMYEGLILSFVNALDAKSQWTKGHSVRVAGYAVKIANEIRLPENDIEVLNTAALLHDIGKMGTYDTVLDKPGKLNDEEFALVRMHPAKGAEILKPVRQFKPLLPVIRHHHERIDGKGYPDGLKGEEIPFMARILHVADSFDSMTADRPYRQAPGIEYAVSELTKYRGLQFDPQVVEAFQKILDKETR